MNNYILPKKLELVPIEVLVPYQKNSRTHSDEQVKQIAASIKEFGFTQPILIDGARGIIAGHGRLMAAKLLGLTEVPVVMLDHLSDAQKRAYIIADNKLALNAGWDEQILAAEMADLKDLEFDLSLVGFSDEELDDLFRDADEVLAPGDAEDVPEPRPDPKVVKGEVYILGKHRLLCGDSTVLTDVEKLMNGAKADLIITDPPYNVTYTGKTKDALTIQNDSMGAADFYQFLYDVYTNLYAVTDDGAGIYVFHADSEGSNFRKAMVDAGFKLAQCCIWVKNSLVMGRQDYHWQHEPVLYGWKDTAAHRWYSDRKQTTLWNFNRPTRSGEHPTMKPIDLIEYPLNNSSKRGDNVLDLFGGSGSTLIACEKNARSCYTMELDPVYCQVILDRWQKFSGKKATREEDNKPWDEIRGA